MNQSNFLPSSAALRALADAVTQGCDSFTVHPLEGSFSNHTYRVELAVAEGAARQVVLRIYEPVNGDCPGKARREFYTLELLRRHGIPVSAPLLMDETGRLLGWPGIVTEFVPGALILAAEHPREWIAHTAEAAGLLARIHRVPLPEAARSYLLDGSRAGTWFLKSGSVPDYMLAHPDGAAVWQAVRERRFRRLPVEPGLVHLDYWSGNLLWDGERVAAVLDWEEASYGDPGLDVAYCLMEYALEGMDAAAEEFLRTYEQAAGRPVANLSLWELAAAARPMAQLDEWLTRPGMHERFRRFIDRALANEG